MPGAGGQELYKECERCALGMSDATTRRIQKDNRCCLVTIPERQLAPPGYSGAWYMGGPSTIDEGGLESREVEDGEDGCPGGWYRCIWWHSVAQYLRPHNGDGVYSSSVLLEQVDDKLIRECVAYFEAESTRARAFSAQLREKDQKKHTTNGN